MDFNKFTQPPSDVQPDNLPPEAHGWEEPVDEALPPAHGMGHVQVQPNMGDDAAQGSKHGNAFEYNVAMLPLDEWVHNTRIDVSSLCSVTPKGGAYMPADKAIRWFRENYPGYYYDTQIVPAPLPAQGLFVTVVFRSIYAHGAPSQVFTYPVRQLGTGDMRGIVAPTSRQCHDATMAAIRKAISLWTGFGFALYERDLSPDESADVDAIVFGQQQGFGQPAQPQGFAQPPQQQGFAPQPQYAQQPPQQGFAQQQQTPQQQQVPAMPPGFAPAPTVLAEVAMLQQAMQQPVPQQQAQPPAQWRPQTTQTHNPLA